MECGESPVYPGMRFGVTNDIGMKVLEIEVGNELLLGILELAERQYGDREPASVSHVVEDALLVRLMLSERLGIPGQEMAEPIINLELQEPEGERTKTEINDWLFRRKPS